MAIDVLKNHIPGISEHGISTDENITTTGTLTGASVVGAVAATTATVSSTLDVTGATTLGGAVNYKHQVTDTGGAFATAIVLTAAQSGRVILVDDAAGLDFTLPAIAAAQIGTTFTFLVTTTITSNSLRITAATGDLLNGAVWLADFDTANTGTYFAADGSDDLIITMNGTTTGGKKGTWLKLTAISATGWFVQGNAFGDGTLATPFS